MTEIKLYNTKTKRKDPLEPVTPGKVSMYVCGPTVYDRAHIGNARPVIVFDTLFRLLRHVYGASNVRYVRNFTDVDDKINATAAARKQAGADGTLEQLIAARSDETIAWYLADMAAVGALEPTDAPRATAYIAQMIEMAEDLIAKGHAYAAEGHVLFAVDSYAEYGALSGRSVEDMIAGARVEVAPYKRNPMDFVIWKPSDADTPGWDSPWGRGRPGWHIECSAMAHDLLGEAFDIHGGGNDLMFPHHENEIAQSRCAGHAFARVWMHNEMLQVEGKKMSKSLGNFFTVRDLLDQGVPGEVIRFVFLSTHYRKPMDWTERKAQEAKNTLEAWALLTKDVEASSQLPTAFLDALANDLNTAGAIAEMHKMKTEMRFSDLKACVQFMSLDLKLDDGDHAFFEAMVNDLLADDLEKLAEKLSAVRAEAMASKDFSAVDALKAALTEAGVEVRMSKDGVELVPGAGFDPAKLEGLL